MSKYVCDCGQVYTNLDALMACQNSRHEGAADAEYADALDACIRAGVNPYAIDEEDK